MPENSAKNLLAVEPDFLGSQIIEDKSLPRFIRKARIFSAENKFYKVFSKIGLPNFSISLDSIKINNAKFASAQSKAVISCINYSDTFVGSIAKYFDKRYFVRRFRKLIKEVDTFIGQEKTLSSINNGEHAIHPYRIRFSGNGANSIWDIATMSMRGIDSCQRWGTNQANCLVGSMVDPCCGIIYITEDVSTKYGSNMKYRSVVRLVFHPSIGPALFLEKTYHSTRRNHVIETLFAQVLHAKTGLPVFHENMKIIFQGDLPKILRTPIVDMTDLYEPTYSDAELKYVC